MHLLLLVLLGVSLPQTEERVDLRFDASEAEAVLSIVDKHEAGEPVGEEDWRRLFDTEPYQRLQRRESEMQRAFTDSAFREFVLSGKLAGSGEELRRTLEQWRSQELRASAERVLAYLPPEARIRATVYPVIKPMTNSFVYDLRGDPAIFLYLDPEQSAAKFENTVAHELHHIGFATIGQDWDSVTSALPTTVRSAVGWMRAFGEGFAMLAAAGDVETHPHAVSPAKERERWDADLANFNRNLQALDTFFLDVIDGRLLGEQRIRQRAFSFFGEQGPWYTVGYKMAVIVERRYGRATLVADMVDPRALLAHYNAAAAERNAEGGEDLALWSPRLLQLVEAPQR